MARFHRVVALLLLAGLSSACGGGHGTNPATAGASSVAGLVSINAPFFGQIPVPFTLTLAAPVGTVAGGGGTPMVRFDAQSGTPFGGSGTILVPGSFATATTVTGTSPLASLAVPVVCDVVLVLPNGLEIGGITAAFNPATLTGFNPASIPSATPTPFVVTGTGFGPVAGNVTVRFRASAGTPFAGGTAATLDVTGMIAGAGTINGTTVDAGVAATTPASVEVLFPGGGMATSAGNVTSFVPPAGRLVINEIDYDQPGTDTAEFIELYNAGPGPVNLDAIELQIVNGTGGGATVVRMFDLPNVVLAANDYYVISANAATVPNTDLVVAPATNLIQNGAPDAVAIVDTLTMTIVDTVSYEGSSGAPYLEGSGGAISDDPSIVGGSIARSPDGQDTDDNANDFVRRAATPGTSNDP